MIFLDAPRFVPRATYEQAIEKVVRRLASRSDVRAVYQLGSTTSPGISDIDLLVVSNDKPTERTDPLVDLDEDQRYLFTHDLFGIPARDFQQFRRFTMYHNYRFLWGAELDTESLVLDVDEQRVLKEQIAFEFLLSNYIARTIDLSYGVASIRGLLLSGHALRYDLDFLGVSTGPLHEIVSQLVFWRGHWFERQVVPELQVNWLTCLCSAIRDLLSTRMRGGGIYLPCNSSVKLARHISLERADTLGMDWKGVPLPQLSRFLGKTAKKLMNRLNHFRFAVPYRSDPHYPILSERFEFLSRMMALKTAGCLAFQVPTNNLVHMMLLNMQGTATVAGPVMQNRNANHQACRGKTNLPQVSKDIHS